MGALFEGVGYPACGSADGEDGEGGAGREAEGVAEGDQGEVDAGRACRRRGGTSSSSSPTRARRLARWSSCAPFPARFSASRRPGGAPGAAGAEGEHGRRQLVPTRDDGGATEQGQGERRHPRAWPGRVRTRRMGAVVSLRNTHRPTPGRGSQASPAPPHSSSAHRPRAPAARGSLPLRRELGRVLVVVELSFLFPAFSGARSAFRRGRSCARRARREAVRRLSRGRSARSLSRWPARCNERCP